MPRLQQIQQSYNAGEISDRLSARTDFSKFRNAVEEAQNVIPMPEGGLARRPSTRYVAEIKDSSVKGRFKDFEHSTEQAYGLEMGNQSLRFYRNQGQIVAGNITASVTNGDFASDISGWTDSSSGGGSISHDATNSRMNLIGGGGTAHAEQEITNALAGSHVVRFRVLGAPGDAVQLRIGTSTGGSQIVSDFTAYVGYHSYEFTATAANFFLQFRHSTNKTLQIDDISLIDNAAVEIGTPWAESDLFRVEGPQSLDVLYQFHNAYPTHKLQRRGHATWSLVEVAWQDGPYLDENTTSTTLTFGAASGNGVTVTASATTGINGDEGFKATDVGRLIRITPSPINWGWAVITGYTSATVVTADIKRNVTTSGRTTWRLGSWSGTTGYPAASTFYEQRLFCAGTTDQQQSLWASNTGDFENMAPDSKPDGSSTYDGTVEDDDALDYTISSDQVDAIRWISAGEDSLSIGTTGGIWSPSSVGAVLTPTDIVVKRQTTEKSSTIQPVRVGRVVLFVQRALRKVIELGFNFEADGLVGFDMTRLAYHVTRGGLVEIAYQEEPHSIVLAVRQDGVLPAMTFRREEDVVGWARHIIGGTFSGGSAVVESVATIPGNNGGGQVQDSTKRDEIWIIVKRTINGVTKRYVEFFEREFETGDAQEDAYYADSLITYDGASTTSITGLGHLEGETVKILADGAVHPDRTVSSGSITLEAAASVVQVGLPYTHRIKSLKMEGGNNAGSAVGRTKRITGLTMVLLNSHSVKFGPDSVKLHEVDFRDVANAMDAPAPLFTGEKRYSFEGDWVTDARYVIEGDDPAPFTLLAVIPETDLKPMA